MHTIDKKEIVPLITLVTQLRSRERRKLHFRESNFTNFPGGIPPDPPRSSCLPHSTFAPAARTVHVRQLNNCIRYFQMLPKTLRRTSANCRTKTSIYVDSCLTRLYNGHFLLSPRWPLQRGSTVYKWNSKKRYVYVCLPFLKPLKAK